MRAWLREETLGRDMVLVRLKVRERPRAVNAPRLLQIIDEFLDFVHGSSRAQAAWSAIYQAGDMQDTE